MALKWYVVHAYSNFENKVKASLEERIKLHGLEEKFGKVMVPTEEIVEMREGQQRRSERDLLILAPPAHPRHRTGPERPVRCLLNIRVEVFDQPA